MRAPATAATVALAGFASGSVTRAVAEPGVAPAVELRYSAPAGCPTRDAVQDQIAARTAVRFAARAPRVFAITVVEGAEGYAGALVADRGADKQLAAARCDDLVNALALVTALAIDADGTAPPAPVVAAPAVAPPARWTPDLAIGAGMIGGVTPDPLLAGSIEARASRRHWTLGLAVLGGRDATTIEGPGEGAVADFGWLSGRLAGCRRGWLRGVEASGCVHVEAGLVRASGEQIINGRDLDRMWLATGVHGVLRWPAASRGFAQLQLGAAAPLLRDRYRFMPGIVVHETAAVTGWVSLGAGVRFR